MENLQRVTSLLSAMNPATRILAVERSTWEDAYLSGAIFIQMVEGKPLCVDQIIELVCLDHAGKTLDKSTFCKVLQFYPVMRLAGSCPVFLIEVEACVKLPILF